MFAMLMKETRPFVFFGLISGAVLAASIAFMLPVLAEYFHTGFVSRVPTWILSMALMMVSLLVFTAGLILDSLSRARNEQLRLSYISQPGLVSTASRDAEAVSPAKTSRRADAA
jgi:hypothetical protein